MKTYYYEYTQLQETIGIKAVNCRNYYGYVHSNVLWIYDIDLTDISASIYI